MVLYYINNKLVYSHVIKKDKIKVKSRSLLHGTKINKNIKNNNITILEILKSKHNINNK